MKAVVVGGGIFGTMHALLALEAGHEVVHIERDPRPLSASVRNFGLVWVSGRAVGRELEIALRARELWQDIGSRADIGFRPQGSLTIARNQAEFDVMVAAASMPDAHARGFRILDRNQVQTLEPVLQGNFVGALQCIQDAAVEPPLLLNGLRNYLHTNPGYTWKPDFEVINFYHDETGNHVTSISGEKVSGDLMAICPGSAHHGFLSEFLTDVPLRRVHLQMGATVPFAASLNHSIADADSMRYYPAFKDLALDSLPPQDPIAAEYKMQLLLVQRFDRSFTIGDTHSYDEPFSHEIVEAPYDHLRSVISAIFGSPAPLIARRWSGNYSQSTNEDIYFRRELAPGAVVVTGGGGRGNTISPAIAEETVNSWPK
ncbi:MAG: FAD-dependent oxidoreductase [Actinomycetota bacterium]